MFLHSKELKIHGIETKLLAKVQYLGCFLGGMKKNAIFAQLFMEKSILSILSFKTLSLFIVIGLCCFVGGTARLCAQASQRGVVLLYRAGQEVIALVQEGRFEEAIVRYEEQNLTQQLQQGEATRRQLQHDQQLLDSAIQNKDQEIERLERIGKRVGKE